MSETGELEATARQLRRDVLTMVYRAGDGHPGAALSAADIVTALYFRLMRVDPRNPTWPERDRFVLSKGHACPVLYAALARRGFFSPDVLPTLRSLGSMLQGHPDMNKTPGVDMTTGSLGHGISIGTGMVVASRVLGRDYAVYTVLGDGELNEGLVWEGATSAVRLRASGLIAFIDANGFQSDGPVEAVSGMRDVARRFDAWGWQTQEIDGHDMRAILDAAARARAERERPSVIVAHTVKGKGVPFMEGDNSWHKRVPTAEEYAAAMRALGESP